MTRDEAIKMMKAKLECMKHEVNGHWGYGNRKCDDCKLNYEQGTLGDQIEWMEMAINALEPCEDAISRQAAIDAIWDGSNMDIYTREVKECLEALPTVSTVIIKEG